MIVPWRLITYRIALMRGLGERLRAFQARCGLYPFRFRDLLGPSVGDGPGRNVRSSVPSRVAVGFRLAVESRDLLVFVIDHVIKIDHVPPVIGLVSSLRLHCSPPFKIPFASPYARANTAPLAVSKSDWICAGSSFVQS